MNISDEQYEDMQRRITELTMVLGYLVVGKRIDILRDHLRQFEQAYSGFNVMIYFNDPEYIRVEFGVNDEAR